MRRRTAHGPGDGGFGLRAVLFSSGPTLLGIGLISGTINVLYLTGSLFMLEVYDRVLPSRSVPTLVGLALLAALLFGFQAVLDTLRSRIFVRLGGALDESLGQRVYDAILRTRLSGRASGDGLQPMRDLDQVRGFLSSSGPAALFDLPWMPLYLAICFAFHTLIGLAALGGAVVLVTMTLLTEILTKSPSRASAAALNERSAIAETSRRNAESLVALGMAPAMGERWHVASRAFRTAQRRTADVAGGFGAVARTLRMMLQSAVLGIGAYLVIHGEATAGIIIASSILTARRSPRSTRRSATGKGSSPPARAGRGCARCSPRSRRRPNACRCLRPRSRSRSSGSASPRRARTGSSSGRSPSR